MADTKISALTAAGSAAAANELPINEAGTSKKVTAAQIKTFVNNAPVFAAGSASAGSWPLFTSGTVLTTPEDGAIELDADCFYGCTDAGNRGYIPVRHFIRADVTRSPPNDTNLNAIFNSPANGRLTLETGTYMFEGLIQLTGMSATSGNVLIDILGAGTATLATLLWVSYGMDASTLTTPGTCSTGGAVTKTSGASVIAAATGTAMYAWLRGTFEVSGAGTLIPSMKLVTASATTLAAGSYLMFERIGSQTVVSVGQWD